MERERGQRMTEIFRTVLAAPREERATLLERACSGDAEMRREVGELLRASEEAWGSGSGKPEAVPQAIGKYEIVERIGQGGFGEVFLGRDPVIKRDVAVKLCTSADEALKQRFFREAEIVGRLKHTNITTVHDSGSFGEVPFMVQEYLPGEDLAHLIRGRRQLSASARLSYLVQIARGLEYAHGMGVIHRDVKPSNIRVMRDGTVKILDFGVARLLSAKTRLTKTGIRIGTECYMAPEQLRGEQAGVRADVFSFGVVAYELMSYVHPFRAAHGPAMIYKVLEEDPVPLGALWPSCPLELDECIDHCLEKEARDRPAGMTEVRGVLEGLELPDVPPTVTATEVTAVRGSRPAHRRRRPRRRAWPRRLAVAVGALVLGVVAFLIVRRLPERSPAGPAPEAAEMIAETGAAEEGGSPPVELVPEPTGVVPEPVPPESAAETQGVASRGLPGATPARNPKESTGTEARLDGSPRRKAVGIETSEKSAPADVVPETPPASASEGDPGESLATAVPAELAASAHGPVDLPAAAPAVEIGATEIEAAAAPPPAPAPAAVPGNLVINALPWASVGVTVSGSPEAVSLPSRYTPLTFALPPGSYDVNLTGAGSTEHRCEVEVRSGATASCLVRLARVKARDFFARDQPAGPAARPPQFRPGDPGPGGAGRGDPRGPPPRLEGSGPPPRREKVPGWIQDAAQAYFDGDYANALDLLAQDTAKKKMQRFYVGLFRGASRYSLYLLGGEGDASLAEAAVEDLKECRRQRPTFVPHPDFFSPRFIEFFSVAAAP